MNLKYYLTNISQLPIALITTALFIIFCELVYKWHILIILLTIIISFGIYCILYWIDLLNYNNYIDKIKS